MLSQDTLQYLKEMGLKTKAGRLYTRPKMKDYKNRSTLSHRGFEMHYTLYQTWNDERWAYDNQYIEEQFGFEAKTLNELKTKVDQEIYDK